MDGTPATWAGMVSMRTVGRVGSRAAGNVDADALDWRELRPADAGAEGIDPGLFDLPFMISPDVGGRFFEDGHEIGTDDVDGGVDFFRRNEETVQIHAIEALRIFPDSCVAALFDMARMASTALRMSSLSA